MDEVYVLEGWESAQVRVRRFWAGITGPNPLFIRVSGDREPPSPPVSVSRAEVYRWLAGLEEQGFVSAFTKGP
jgi:hypothetical protein